MFVLFRFSQRESRSHLFFLQRLSRFDAIQWILALRLLPKGLNASPQITTDFLIEFVLWKNRILGGDGAPFQQIFVRGLQRFAPFEALHGCHQLTAQGLFILGCLATFWSCHGTRTARERRSTFLLLPSRQ